MGTALLILGSMIVLYPLVVYPAILALAAAVQGRGMDEEQPREVPNQGFPTISITVPVYNEIHQIEGLLESLVALDYPKDRRQILVVSDGSTDGTDQAVDAWAHRGVELLTVAERGGKGAAENAARPHLTGEIVVNTDASVRIRPDALRYLTRPFRDPLVGVVSGRDISVARDGADANAGEGGYVGYEMKVRELETLAGGIVGASGCLYATRAHLQREPVLPQLSRDFASVLIAQDHGYRALSAPGAICYVPRTGSVRKEYGRKVRTVARGMSTLWAWRHLMNPIRHPVFAWKLLSHKAGRWAMPFGLLSIVAGLAFLAPTKGWAGLGLGIVVVFTGLGLVGWRLSRPDRMLSPILSVPAYLIMANVAVLHALGRVLSRGPERLWEPTRRGSVAR